MRYYRIPAVYVYQGANPTDFTIKCPSFMKAYPYYKLGIKFDGSEYLVQSNHDIPEATELTLEDAQSVENEWATQREKITVYYENNGQIMPVEMDSLPIDIAACNCQRIIDLMKSFHRGVN